MRSLPRYYLAICCIMRQFHSFVHFHTQAPAARLQSGNLQWRVKQQNFPEFPENSTTSYVQNFENFFIRISVPFDSPIISRILGRMASISKIQQFSDFLETFSGNFHTICPHFDSSGNLV